MGDAYGLRALGWHVTADESGRKTVRCPLHRTDRVPCRDPMSHGVGADDATCSLCSAENEAKGWQCWISGRPAGETLGDPEEAPWTT